MIDIKHFASSAVAGAFVFFYLIVVGTNKYIVQKHEKSIINFQKTMNKKMGLEKPYSEPSSLEALKNNPVKLTKSEWDLINNLVDEVNQSFEAQQAVKNSPVFWRKEVGIDK